MNLLRTLRLRHRPGPGPIDLAAPEVTIDPFPHYETLRRNGPVQHLPNHGFWIVLGYDAVTEAFERPALFSSAPHAEIDRVLLAGESPGHGAVRRLIARRFSSEALDRVATSALAAAARMVRPRMDVVEDYGFPITWAMGAALLGLDEPDVADIVAVSAAARTAPEPLAALVGGLNRLAPRAALFRTLLDEGEGAFGEQEAASLVCLLWLAATTTTERVLTRSVLRLLQHPDVREAVTGDPSLIPAFIEEVTRLHPPELMVPRLTAAPATLAGVDIPAGAVVRLCVAAANRDPAAFEAPAELRLNRPGRRHLSFGRGLHLCVGASLARRVLAGALLILIERIPRFRALEPLDSIPHFHSLTALAPTRLAIGGELA